MAYFRTNLAIFGELRKKRDENDAYLTAFRNKPKRPEAKGIAPRNAVSAKETREEKDNRPNDSARRPMAKCPDYRGAQPE